MRTAEPRSPGKWFGCIASPSSFPCSAPDTGGIVSLGAAKLRRLLSPADRGPRAMAPPPASAPPPPRVPRGGRRAVPEPPCGPLGPPRGFPAATGFAPRSLPGSAGASQAPAGAAVPGVRGLPPRRDLPGRAAALGAAPAGGLVAVGSGERGLAPRGAALSAAGRPGRGGCAVCGARGHRQCPERFTRLAPAVSAAGGGSEGGRCSGGRQTAPFPPGGASRRLGERGAAGRRRLGWREQRVPGGSGQELRLCSRGAGSPDRSWGWRCSSRCPPFALPGECGCSLRGAGSCPAATSATCCAACPVGGAGGAAALPRGTPGGAGGLAWSGAGWAQQPGASGRRRQGAGAFAFAVVSAPTNY